MANVKITELSSATTLGSTDVFPVVDVGSTQTKKVTVTDLLRNTPDGTAGAPSIANAGDQDTGILFPAENSVGVSTGGTQRLVIDSSGNCGIGTTSPTSRVHALSGVSDNPHFLFKSTESTGTNNSGDLFKIEHSRGTGNSSALLNVLNSAGSVLYVEGTGNVGIGNTSPDATLRVTKSAVSEAAQANDIAVFERNDNGYIKIYSANNKIAGLAFGDPEDAFVGAVRYNHSGNVMDFIVDGSEKARIDSSGRLLLGTTTEGDSSADNLTVADSGGCGITIRSGTSNTGSIFFSDATSGSGEYDGFLQYNQSDRNFKIGTATSTRLTIDSSGNVGIGTSSPTSYANSQAALVIEDDTNPAICWSDTGQTRDWWAVANGSNLSFIYADGGGSGSASNVTQVLSMDNSGNVGVGTSSPFRSVHVSGSSDQYVRITSTNSANAGIEFGDSDDPGRANVIYSNSTDSMLFTVNGSERARIDSSGKVYFGDFSSLAAAGYIDKATSGNYELDIVASRSTTTNRGIRFFSRSNSESMRIDTSGRLLIGTSSSKSVGAGQYAPLNVQGYIGSAAGGGELCLSRGEAASSITADDQLGAILFTDSAGYGFGSINCKADGTAGSSDYPGRLEFKTAADGSGSMTERMRIGSNGYLYFANQTAANPAAGGSQGLTIRPDPLISIAANGNSCANFGRNTNDGTIVNFYQAGTAEGSISVSGSTVSYNGGHLARWSQLAGGAERTEILRGSVLSNLDEMCEWGEEDNEQLNRMQVSNVEGDINVAGVFQSWDDDDDTYTNDFYCAMTGDFIIRIAQGVTVQRGNLLMSAGDGTAKPQGDGFIQDKTIAKVTSTTVSTTYADGSYCVPCVLMAC